MSKIDLTSNAWIDLVFEKKNKDYGAYQMRKDSPRRHYIALILVVVVVVFLFVLPSLFRLITPTQVEQKIEVGVTEIEQILQEAPDEKVEEHVEIIIPEEIRNTVEFRIDITRNEVDEARELRTVDEVVEDTRAVGAVDVNTGTDNVEVIATVTDIVQPKVDDTVYTNVEEMPSFIGGEAALFAYLSKNTKYPAIAQETGVKGKVYVSFVVSKTGEITDIKVDRSPSEILSTEALRVIRSMPAWKPGKQNGQAVKVKYTVPVNFQLN